MDGHDPKCATFRALPSGRGCFGSAIVGLQSHVIRPSSDCLIHCSQSKGRRLKAAADCLREGIGETTTYLLPEFPDGRRRRIRTNNMIERLNREIRRRTRVVGGFPDGNSALMLVCARIRYVTANEWSTRRYLDMSRLDDTLQAAN